MSFKNQAEIFKALLDGKKIRHNSWDTDRYRYMKSGFVEIK